MVVKKIAVQAQVRVFIEEDVIVLSDKEINTKNK